MIKLSKKTQPDDPSCLYISMISGNGDNYSLEHQVADAAERIFDKRGELGLIGLAPGLALTKKQGIDIYERNIEPQNQENDNTKNRLFMAFQTGDGSNLFLPDIDLGELLQYELMIPGKEIKQKNRDLIIAANGIDRQLKELAPYLSEKDCGMLIDLKEQKAYQRQGQKIEEITLTYKSNDKHIAETSWEPGLKHNLMQNPGTNY